MRILGHRQKHNEKQHLLGSGPSGFSLPRLGYCNKISALKTRSGSIQATVGSITARSVLSIVTKGERKRRMAYIMYKGGAVSTRLRATAHFSWLAVITKMERSPYWYEWWSASPAITPETSTPAWPMHEGLPCPREFATAVLLGFVWLAT